MVDRASLELLLDHAQDKVVLLDDRGRFTYVNDAADRILGFAPDDLVGEDAFDYIHPEDFDAVRAAFRAVIESDRFTEQTVEYRHRAADGSWVWLESRMSNLTDDALDGYVVSSRDVTDRVEAEHEHRETAARLEELAATSGDVLWMFDADWEEVLFVNPAYEDVYGASTAELRRRPESFLETVHPEDVPAIEEAMARLSGGSSVDMEYRVDPTRNYNRWVWVQAEPILVDGEVVRITGFTRDVTDRHRRERQLYVIDNLLRHNLRNDLNLILGVIDHVEAAAPELSERTSLVREVAAELLTSARKERDIIEFLTSNTRPEHVDLAGSVGAVVAAVRDQYPAATIDTSLPDEAPAYALQEIDLAVEELLENSILHAQVDDPRVGVSVHPEGDSVSLVVEDDCPPIPDAEADVLTGDHDMNDVYHSSGLGFWLTYWVVDSSNGDITVERAGDGDGNHIRITLPRNGA